MLGIWDEDHLLVSEDSFRLTFIVLKVCITSKTQQMSASSGGGIISCSLPMSMKLIF